MSDKCKELNEATEAGLGKPGRERSGRGLKGFEVTVRGQPPGCETWFTHAQGGFRRRRG